MKHAEKIRLARSLSRTAVDDDPPRAGIFDTEAWERRKYAIAERVRRTQRVAHNRAIARRQRAWQAKQEEGYAPLFSRAKLRIRAELQRQIDARKARHARHAAKQTAV